MAKYRCVVCEYVYDEDNSSSLWMDVPEDYTCPVCGSAKKLHEKVEDAVSPSIESSQEEKSDLESDNGPDDSMIRTSDDIETTMADIHQMAESGESITEPMRTRVPTFSWDELLIKGAQLATLPLNKDEQVETETIIGPGAAKPLIITGGIRQP